MDADSSLIATHQFRLLSMCRFSQKALFLKMPCIRTHIQKKKVTLLSLSVMLLLLSRRTQTVVSRACYVEKTNLERKTDGEYYTLVPKLRKSPKKHFKYFRMSKELFDWLLDMVGSKLKRAPTHTCTVSPGERLALTLHYRLGYSTVSTIFTETVRIIWDELKDTFVPNPTKETWTQNATDFAELWQFPLCVGAIDGKNVVIKCPHNSGTEYYNYNKSYSIVLMAIVDAKYRFVAVDVGGFGRQSDGGTFGNWALGNAIKEKSVDLPLPTTLCGTHTVSPHVFLADAAFPLTENIMCPYPGVNLSNEQRIFNYRLSRARRIVENAFGILATRWRILQKCIDYQPKVVDNIILACVALHNFMRFSQLASAENTLYMPPKFVDWFKQDGTRISGTWRKDVNEDASMFRLQRRKQRHQVNEVRNNLRDYFSSSCGSVSWQNNRALGVKKRNLQFEPRSLIRVANLYELELLVGEIAVLK